MNLLRASCGERAVRVVVIVACLSICLAGCFGWDQRRGLDPVLNPVAVTVATTNQIVILDALAKDAGVDLGSRGAYYEVTQAGFNFIDDECKTYFNAIFFLNREKDQVKAGLAAAGA